MSVLARACLLAALLATFSLSEQLF